jgi:hypothetical protein
VPSVRAGSDEVQNTMECITQEELNEVGKNLCAFVPHHDAPLDFYFTTAH